MTKLNNVSCVLNVMNIIHTRDNVTHVWGNGDDMNTETRSREYLRDLVMRTYTPKIPYASGTRVCILGQRGTIAGHRFSPDNPIDPVYVVMFDNGGVNTHVIHAVITVS